MYRKSASYELGNNFHNNGCFIIPSSFFEKKIKEGSPKERERALYNLKISQLIRGRRIAHARYPIRSVSALEEMRREVYDMQNDANQADLPGKLVREEGASSTGDQDVGNCYQGTGNVYKFYKQIFNRNSIDDHGMTITSSVHLGDNYDNAFWDGQQMAYGDGDDQFMRKHELTALQDVTGHEMTHGVTQYTSRLDYEGESGGLNESMSDCFGIMILQWVNNQTVDAAHWLIGEGLMVEGKALRSMKDPGNQSESFPGDNQIKNYQDFRADMDPHQSSGIGNYTFYLACKNAGGSGHSWDKIGKVWYITNTTRLHHNSGFQDAANNTFSVAGSLFGEGSNEQKAIYNAWKQAGLEAKEPDLTIHLKARTKRR